MKTSRKNEIGIRIMFLIIGVIASAIGFIVSESELNTKLALAGLACAFASSVFLLLSMWLLLGLSGKN